LVVAVGFAIVVGKPKHNSTTLVSTVESVGYCFLAVSRDSNYSLLADKLGFRVHKALYMDETAHGGTLKMDWGGIPLVILVGDDYQIPPNGYGAFHSFSPIKKKEDNKPINPGQLACRMIGFNELKADAKNVIHLKGVIRESTQSKTSFEDFFATSDVKMKTMIYTKMTSSNCLNWI
jgi:hypothetical protein